jgi:EmrB/QacA subfamily drug resistance transporter
MSKTHPQTSRPLVLGSVMLAMFMIAIETTIVSTAMPQIAGQLGDLHLYAWVFAAFLLTQTATTVLFGKLADQFGRKPVLLVGIAVFLVGTTLCGLAWSMPSLIAFRLIQGVGAGAIQPVSITVIGDLYSLQERGKIQGYLASVWGVSSVFGPLAGGLIVAHLSWAWVFWINLPIGLAAATGFMRFLHEDVARQARRVDGIGATLFAVAVAALMLAITELGSAQPAVTALAGGVFAVASVLFVLQELRAPEPMMAFGLWGRRGIATANAATLLSGMALIGLTTFLPMYVQGVMAQSALVAGFALTMMVLGWPIGATVAAKNFVRFGPRATLLFGAVLLPVGAVAFLVLGPTTSVLVAGGGSIVMGLGMGFLSSSAIVMIQASVGWAERGAATASNVFARNLGSTLGATVLGGVLTVSLRQGAGVSYEQVRGLLENPAGRIGEAAVRGALGQGLHLTFWGVFATALLVVVFAMMVPRPAEAPAAAD